MNAAEYDVVCVGSGAAGLTAAIVSASLGLKALVLEKAAQLGGATAVSAGAVWIPANHLMPPDCPDTIDAGRTYLRNLIGKGRDEAKVEAYLAQAPQMLRYMEAHSQVKFVGLNSPDYAVIPGAARGRTLMPAPYHGAQLGNLLSLIRPPLPALTILGGMQVQRPDVAALLQAHRSLAAFRHSAGLVGRYLIGRLKHGRDPRLVGGNALVGRLVKSAADAGVELRVSAPVRRLEREPGGGYLVVTMGSEGKDTTWRARRAVILASGGFSADSALRHRFIPMADRHLTAQPDGNTGDGLRLGTSLGGRMDEDNAAPAIWSPISAARMPGGEQRVYPHLMLDRLKPGSIIVGPNGRRFVNEGLSYHEVVTAMHRAGVAPAYLVGDRAFLRKYGMGLVRPAPCPIGWALNSGYLVEADTIDALAAKLQIDSVALARTIAAFNEDAAVGKDHEFARGEDPHSRYHGDPQNKTNPSLGPIRQAPFYAIVLYPGDLGTVQGLITDEHARVLDAKGAAIPGLYACGADMNSIMRGHYPGGGTSIGLAMTFGHIAARHIAASETGGVARGTRRPAFSAPPFE